MTLSDRRLPVLAAGCLILALAAGAPSFAQSQGNLTEADARKLVEEASARLLDLGIEAQRASWVQSTYITYDTEILAAQRNEVLLGAAVDYAQRATRFDGVKLPEDLRRQIDLLKRGLTLPAPADPKKTGELARLAATLESQYGSGKYCPQGAKGDDCKDLTELENILAENRDPGVQLDAWVGWHGIAPPMRDEYQRLVEIANEGSRELGYKDTGALWRSKYDMDPDAFAAELDRLYQQVRPLYESLHCYVRARLNQKYGDQLVPLDKPIPAHLLGNMWAQDWSNIYDLVAPPQADPGYSLNQILKSRNVDAKEMVRFGERFFTSMGFEPLPETFWERSLFTKPADRDVVCHASAWSLDYKDDLRIKMCIEPTEEDFRVIHHELGHNFYQRAYSQQPLLYQESANDGFHEAVGDTVALSITPEYLKQIGMIEQVPDPSKDLGLLMRLALDKVAFLPFGLLIDQWRWKVFSGEYGPDEYNEGWWELREKYQGVRAPVARSEKDFDAGAKYHVPGNTPYARYFLADILQFQLHRGLCQAAGNKGPLNRCSIYGSAEAGKRLNAMLAMGQSRPWPEALKVVTGQDRMDATAILDYFAPLKTWLDQQNKGQKCGW
jgi:peptidyl-dipeptidase A